MDLTAEEQKELDHEIARRLRIIARALPAGHYVRTLLMLAAESLLR